MLVFSAQFRVLERWREKAEGKDNLSVKWLLVTFLAEAYRILGDESMRKSLDRMAEVCWQQVNKDRGNYYPQEKDVKANWWSANQVDGEPAPAVPGIRETLTVEVKDRQDREPAAFDLATGKLLYKVSGQGAGEFGEYGRVSATVQQGCTALLGKNTLTLSRTPP